MQREGADGVLICIIEAPGFDHHIVHVNAYGNDEAEESDIGRCAMRPDNAKDAGGGVKSFLAACATHRPFKPGDGNSQQKQGDKIRNHEGAAFVFRGKARESQEVAEPDGASHNGKDDSKHGSP